MMPQKRLFLSPLCGDSDVGYGRKKVASPYSLFSLQLSSAARISLPQIGKNEKSLLSHLRPLRREKEILFSTVLPRPLSTHTHTYNPTLHPFPREGREKRNGGSGRRQRKEWVGRKKNSALGPNGPSSSLGSSSSSQASTCHISSGEDTGGRPRSRLLWCVRWHRWASFSPGWPSIFSPSWRWRCQCKVWPVLGGEKMDRIHNELKRGMGRMGLRRRQIHLS